MGSNDHSIANLHRRIRGESIKIRGVERGGWKLSPQNLKTVLEYDSLLVAKGRKPSTRVMHITTIANLAQMAGKAFLKMEEKDIIPFVASIERKKGMSPETKNTYKQALITFFKWIHGSKRDWPKCVEFIEFNGKGRKKTSDDLLTREEVYKMVEACDHPRDRALITTMYESSCRRGEIISCRVKHLRFNGDHAVIVFPEDSVSRTGRAKTGSYEALLFDAAPYLKAYMDYHPERSNPEAPLFISIAKQDYGKALENDGVYQMIRKAAKRAGIRKRVYPHLLRHSISTEWAKQGYTTQEINIRSGRAQNSREADTYIHLSGSNVQDKVLKRERIKRGLATEEETTEESPLEPVKCWACETPNPPTNQFCYNKDCGAELRGRPSERAKEIQVALKVLRTLKRIGDDPELINFLDKRLKT